MSRIRFSINGVPYSVGCEVSSDVTLLDYIRNNAELRGTKYMCREAGCGACIVAAVRKPGQPITSVNSCMVSVTSCQDWEITTIEKVGNRLKGYNALQTTLAQCNGTQCGHCTPGWIMAMYSLIKSKPNITMLELEQSFGGNVCRCTGFRPILDAFKKFAKDYPYADIPDIEELSICKKTGKKCNKTCSKEIMNTDCKSYDGETDDGNGDKDDDDWCVIATEDLKAFNMIEILLSDDKKWYKAYTLADIFRVLLKEGLDSYMLVAGNTAKGAYPIEEYPRVLIDISDVSQLKGHVIDQNLVIGASTTLTEALDLFQQLGRQQEYFGYLMKFYEHVKLVAHTSVRNIGTIAGNLMIKHQHPEFASDIFLLLETVGAQLTLQHFTGAKNIVTMQEFLKVNMKGKIILNVLLPPLSSDYRLVTYKIMPRSQSAHAIVNAGFLYKLNQGTVVLARIVYGGLSPTFIRAYATEKYLAGKFLFRNDTLHTALTVLQEELVVVENPPEPSPAYRGQLAINLFYKSLLTICPANKIPQRYASAVTQLHQTRPVSSGVQAFETDETLYPLNKPIPKLEALIQCSGEAEFTEDVPALPHEVFASFVLSTVPNGTIVSIDPSKALAEPGVIAFYTAKDIPGENSFMLQNLLIPTYEVVLSTGTIDHFHQPIGIIVAESRSLADRASKMVKVTYTNVKQPVLDIKVAKRDPNRVTLLQSITATETGNDVAKVIKGDEAIYGQYHFMMETLVCITNPVDDGLEVLASSQWVDTVHVMMSRVCKIPQNKIDVSCRRVGGGYGMKLTRSTQIAVACGLVTLKLNRPCRFIQSLSTNLKAIGKRCPNSYDYEIGVNNAGIIQYVNTNLYADNGYKVNETLAALGVELYNNCYDTKRWTHNCYNGITDTAKNSWCRAPGTLENIAMAESVMERISYELSINPLQVRLANLDATHKDLKEMSDTLVKKADYNKRCQEVTAFNYANRWKKRGLRFAFMRWRFANPSYMDANLAVYHGDGTVVLTHGGIEMGQGINTKAVQLCAYLLKIPIEKVKTKKFDTTTSPNSFGSGGSFTSQFILVNIKQCCDELNKRLEPIRQKLTNPSWEELIKAAFEASVDLQTHGFVGAESINDYNIYGVTLAEVEIDVLTGEHEVRRVDILQDVGQSVSPLIDVGQIEGAFIMGLGYWTSEHLVYNQKSGELLTDRAWNYHVPLARDIPQDFRVYFRKNSYSTDVFFGSKMTGEPSICMAIAVPFAIREAISAARSESGIPTTSWFQIDGPYTTEQVCLSAMSTVNDFKFVN